LKHYQQTEKSNRNSVITVQGGAAEMVSAAEMVRMEMVSAEMVRMGFKSMPVYHQPETRPRIENTSLIKRRMALNRSAIAALLIQHVCK